jgi:hypothetical protein
MHDKHETRAQARRLCLHLNTFVDLRERGAALALWVEDARLLIEKAFRRWTDGRSFGFDTPCGYWIGIGGADVREEVTPLEWSEDNWHFLMNELSKGRLRTVRLLGHLNDSLALPRNDLGGVRVQVDLAGLEFEGAPSGLVMTAGRPLLGPVLEPDLQSEWISQGKRAAQDFEAATGFITIDYAGAYESPYEVRTRRYWLDGWKESHEWLRGYYWGNFLSERHIRVLGGMKRIAAEAPCDIVEDLSNGRQERAYLQVGPNVDDVSDEALRKLRDFLEPVLPPRKDVQ